MVARTSTLLASLLFLAACQSSPTKESEPMCQKRKPGTIVSVNEYCAIVPVDPVDPSVVVQWKTRAVGLCCKGCVPKWEKLTDAEKDTALAAAIAKGPI